MLDFIEKKANKLKKLWSNKRQLAFHCLNLAMSMLFAPMIWKSLMVVTKSEMPFIVVQSFMHPICNRGDILFLNNDDSPLRAGEVVMFKIKDREALFVHRIMNIHEKPDGTISVLTKEDFNKVNDRGLYPKGVMWLRREDILGRVKGVLRNLGTVANILNKYILLGLVGLFVLRNRRA